MKSGEFTGRSMDEAVFHGLQELGLSIDEVVIETLQSESKGLFGLGAKLARVRLTQREPDELEPAVQAVPAPERPREKPYAPRREQNDNRPQRNRPERPERPRPPMPARDRDDGQEAEPDFQYDAALAKDHPAGQFLTGLLEKMQIAANVSAAATGDGVRLRIESQTKGQLIGRRGETLDAMQYLTSLCVNRNRKQDQYIRVTLDTEDYRSKREETLRRLAKRQAYRVKTTGRPISMEPMNPYERRVLHASLQGNPYVKTHSEGEEPNRRVVISPK